MRGGTTRAGEKHEPQGETWRKARERAGAAPARDAASLIGELQGDAGNRAVQSLLSSPGTGRALAPTTRLDMERRFGVDFGDVRVHEGEQARRATDALQAKAVTIGRDIAFDDGRYAPQTGEGRRLLAHELAHVVQQSRGGAKPGALAPTAALESGADAAAAQVASDAGAVTVSGASGVGPACDPDEKKKKIPVGLLPAGLEAQLGFTAQPDDDVAVAGVGDDPRMRKLVKDYLDKGKKQQPPTDADPFGLFGGKPPPALPSMDFGADKPIAFPSFTADKPWTPFPGFWPATQGKGESGDARPKPPQKKADAEGKSKLTWQELNAPKWPDWSPERLEDNALNTSRYEIAKWLSKQKNSSPLTMRYAELYKKLRHEAKEREGRRELDAGPRSRTDDDDPEMRFLEGEIKPLLDAVPKKSDDVPGFVGFGDAEQRYGKANEDPAAGMSRIVFPEEFDGSDVRVGKRYIDNFRWISNDIGGNPNYILTYEDGSTVSIPKALVERMKQEKPGGGGKGVVGSIKLYNDCLPGKFPYDIWVFPPEGKADAPLSQGEPIQMPTNWSKDEVPRLLAEIEKNKDVLDTDEKLHFIGREIITFEHVPGSETIGKIMFWTGMAGMGVGLGAKSGIFQRKTPGGKPPPPKGRLSLDALEDFPGYVPRAANQNTRLKPDELEAFLKQGSLPKDRSPPILINVPEGFGKKFPVGNDNDFLPTEPWAMGRTGTDDAFFPLPRSKDPPVLRLAPAPKDGAFDLPLGDVMASSGGRRPPPKPAFGTPEPRLDNATWSAPPVTGNRAADKFEQSQRAGKGKNSLYVWTGRRTSIDTAEHVEFDDFRKGDLMLVDAKARTGKAGSIYDVREANATTDKPGFRQEIVRRKVFKQELARQRSGAKGVVWVVEDPVIAQALREFFKKEGYTTFSVEAPR